MTAADGSAFHYVRTDQPDAAAGYRQLSTDTLDYSKQLLRREGLYDATRRASRFRLLPILDLRLGCQHENRDRFVNRTSTNLFSQLNPFHIGHVEVSDGLPMFRRTSIAGIGLNLH